MTYIEIYKLHPTVTFKRELKEIYEYLAIKLKEPSIANKFYRKVNQGIYSLRYLPQRHNRIITIKGRNIRRLLINNYVVIYEIKEDTRTSIYFTYFSW